MAQNFKNYKAFDYSIKTRKKDERCRYDLCS